MRMTVKQKQLLLMGLGTLLGVSAIVLLIWGFRTPVALPPSPLASVADSAVDPQARSEAVREALDPEELRRLSSRDWRQALDPRSVNQDPLNSADNGAVGASLTVRLIGTVIESTTAAALLQKPDGTIIVCAQGDSFAEAAGKAWVVRVETRRVLVRYGGAVSTLEIPAEPSPQENGTP